MQRIALASKALVSVGYDAATAALEVEFRNGRVYRYRDVPRDMYEFLLRTRQKGSYFNRMINGRYAFEDLSTANVQQDLLPALQASLRHSAELRARVEAGESDSGAGGGAL